MRSRTGCVTNVIGEGEATRKVGSTEKATETVPLTVRYPEGMTPGKPVPFEVFVERVKLNANHPMEVRRLIVTMTNSREGEGCEDNWFKIGHFQGYEGELFGSGLAKPLVITRGSGNGSAFLTEDGAEIELEENAEVNQGACEGAQLTVKVKTEV